MQKIALFVGSLRKDSINKKLADNLEELGSEWFTFNQVRLDDVPMFNQDIESELPDAVLRLKQDVAAADAVIFVTPEYNRSVPPLLKNAIDWCSRPAGQSVWAGKPATMCGISGGAVGTAVAQAHLKSILLMLGLAVITQPEIYLTAKPGFFDDAGRIAAEDTREFLKKYLQRFSNWIKLYRAD